MNTSQPTLKDIISIIFKRKNTIVVFFLSTVFVILLGSLLTRPVYEAKAQVLVKFGRENLYTPPNEARRYLVRYSEEDYILPEIEVIKSRALMEKVIKELGPRYIYPDLDKNETLLALQDSIAATGSKNSNVITITFLHTDPNIAAHVVNTLVSAYLDQHLKIHQNPESYSFFEEQTQLVKRKLEISENDLNRFKEQYSITALAEEQTLLLHQIANLSNSIDNLTGDEADTTNRINQIELQLKTIPKSILQAEEVEYNPELIRNLEEKLVELELKENELLAKYTPESRLIQSVKTEIQVVNTKLTEAQSKRYGRSHTGPNTTYNRLKEDLYQNIIDLKAISAKKKVQKDQLDQLQTKLNELNSIEVQLNRLSQEVDVERQNFMLYLTKFEEARISSEMDKRKISNVSLIQSALIPFQPVRPKIILNVLFSLILGLFGGVGMAFLLEYFDDTIEKPSDVDQILQLPVYTSIQDFKFEH